MPFVLLMSIQIRAHFFSRSIFARLLVFQALKLFIALAKLKACLQKDQVYYDFWTINGGDEERLRQCTAEYRESQSFGFFVFFNVHGALCAYIYLLFKIYCQTSTELQSFDLN